jgi:succinoglycan biosynthesis protein ExoW
MRDSIAVVIPFFQKKPGILRKAIVSALGQVSAENVTIIVVDDSSPVPAKVELVDLIALHPGRILIIEQANAGPAAARNRALDNVPTGTEFVAFLDSDDEWIPEHLANALTALGSDGDFYLADHYQLNSKVSAFQRAGRIVISDHPQIGDTPHLRRFSGNMFNQILSGNIIGTSTVVYRYAKFPQLRFRENFVYAGEDYLFWLELSKLTDKIGFSSQCECTYGEGVNIFAGSGWGTEKSLIRLHYEMKFKKVLPRLFKLGSEQLAANRASVRELRQSFVADVMHRLKHRKPIETATLRDQFRVDPESFVYFFPLAMKILLGR